MSGIETGAEEPAQGPAVADDPAPARPEAGTGTLTGPGAAERAAAGRTNGNGASAHGHRNGQNGNSQNGHGLRQAQPRPPAPDSGPRASGDPGATAPAATMAAATGTAPAGTPPEAPRPAAPVVGGLLARLGVPDWEARWLVVVLPVVAGLAAGGYKIGYPALWRDEATTKIVVVRPVSQIWALVHHTDAVHGAYYLLLHLFMLAFGTSATALRLPSMIAMGITCGFVAAIGHRLAMTAGAPFARFTGLCAGLVFAALPFMTRYAQEARSYAIVTMLATMATYLLIRAVCDGRRWWVCYAVAVAATGLFNIFGLLILVAHGVSLLIAGTRQRAAVARAAVALTEGDGAASAGPSDLALFAPAGLSGRRAGGFPVRWLIAGAAALVVLAPLGIVAYTQRGVLGWMSRPAFNAVVALAYNSAGSWRLITPIFTLAMGGILANLFIDRSRRPLTPGIIAFPWMVMPPALLIGVSQIHPIYDERYVEFCLPALAILVAWGIAWLARLAAATPLARTGLVWLPSATVVLGLIALLVQPDKQIRLNNTRPDNLEAASALVAEHARPGDIIFYIPISGRVAGLAYPGPFKELRDIALDQSPLASATIYGTNVSPAVLKSRFVNVTRVWTISGTGDYEYSGQATAADKEEVSLISGMHEIDHWWDGDTVLRLYAKGPAPTGSGS